MLYTIVWLRLRDAADVLMAPQDVKHSESADEALPYLASLTISTFHSLPKPSLSYTLKDEELGNFTKVTMCK